LPSSVRPVEAPRVVAAAGATASSPVAIDDRPVPADSTPVPLPPGQRLPVRDRPMPGQPAGHVPAAPVIAVPLRVQSPPPSASRNDGPATSSAPIGPIPPSEEGDFWHAAVTQMIAAESITAMA